MKRRLGRWLVRWRTTYSLASLLLVVLVILPGTVYLFPDSNVWLGVLVVVLAAIDELKDLADQIVEDVEDSQ